MYKTNKSGIQTIKQTTNKAEYMNKSMNKHKMQKVSTKTLNDN